MLDITKTLKNLNSLINSRDYFIQSLFPVNNVLVNKICWYLELIKTHFVDPSICRSVCPKKVKIKVSAFRVCGVYFKMSFKLRPNIGR